MNELEEKEDELGERMPAPADYPKVPRRTRRDSHYFRTLSVMSPVEKEQELLKPFRTIPGLEREKLGPRTRVLLFQCQQILDETKNAWKGEGPRPFPSNPDRRQIGWDKELGASFALRIVKNTSFCGMGISTFHEEVRRVTDQAKRGLILVQENKTLAADHRNVDAYLGPMKDGMQVLAMTSAIIGYLAHLQYAKVQNHIIWQSETFRRVVWDALGDEWERMNIEREQGPIHMTCPWLIRFTDNIPRDCPSHLEWYQRLIDRIKTIC
jgi:hypothetical protein